MKNATTILACALLAGCAVQPPVKLVKAGATQADFDQAVAQCEYEAAVATQVTTPGYRTAFGQELDREMRKRELMLPCMKAKGFRPE